MSVDAFDKVPNRARTHAPASACETCMHARTNAPCVAHLRDPFLHTCAHIHTGTPMWRAVPFGPPYYTQRRPTTPYDALRRSTTPPATLLDRLTSSCSIRCSCRSPTRRIPPRCGRAWSILRGTHVWGQHGTTRRHLMAAATMRFQVSSAAISRSRGSFSNCSFRLLPDPIPSNFDTNSVAPWVSQ